jgi:biotin carboxyl carrier protein
VTHDQILACQGFHQHSQHRSLSMSALREPDPPELLSSYAPPPPLPTPGPAAPAPAAPGLGGLAAPSAGGKVVPFLLADIGEGIAEVEMMQWFVREGDSVKQFDRICEVQSDKATVEISSRYDGVVRRVHHGVGAIVKVRASDGGARPASTRAGLGFGAPGRRPPPDLPIPLPYLHSLAHSLPPSLSP